MASFKGIRERINSVKTTRKITSAMKMISSAKLHKAQKTIGAMLPYSDAMAHISGKLLAAGGDYLSPLTVAREPRRVAIIAFSSDSSFAGAYNSNVAKMLSAATGSYRQLPAENILVYTVGKKVYEAAIKLGLKVEHNYENLASHPDYDTVAALAGELMEHFTDGTLDVVEVVYHHFRSAGSQVLVRENLLPLSQAHITAGNLAGELSGGPRADVGKPEEGRLATIIDLSNGDGKPYIFEPSRDELLEEIIPLSVKLRLFTILLDSNASEHAARVIAMQTATDNADDLIAELTRAYNKSRQQAITNELLDMLGGSGS